MLIIDSKDCENIDKALKKYKKKFEKSKVLLQLRERQSYTKPSVKRRNQVLRAVYKQKIASGKIVLNFFKLMQQLLKPQLIGLMNDNEQHFIVFRRR